MYIGSCLRGIEFFKEVAVQAVCMFVLYVQNTLANYHAKEQFLELLEIYLQKSNSV